MVFTLEGSALLVMAIDVNSNVDSLLKIPKINASAIAKKKMIGLWLNSRQQHE